MNCEYCALYIDSGLINCPMCGCVLPEPVKQKNIWSDKELQERIQQQALERVHKELQAKSQLERGINPPEMPPYQELIPLPFVIPWILESLLYLIIYLSMLVYFPVLNNLPAAGIYLLLNVTFLVIISRPSVRRWMVYSREGVPRYHCGAILYYFVSFLWMCLALQFASDNTRDIFSFCSTTIVFGGFVHWCSLEGLKKRRNHWEQYGKPLIPIPEDELREKTEKKQNKSDTGTVLLIGILVIMLILGMLAGYAYLEIQKQKELKITIQQQTASLWGEVSTVIQSGDYDTAIAMMDDELLRSDQWKWQMLHKFCEGMQTLQSNPDIASGAMHDVYSAIDMDKDENLVSYIKSEIEQNVFAPKYKKAVALAEAGKYEEAQKMLEYVSIRYEDTSTIDSWLSCKSEYSNVVKYNKISDNNKVVYNLMGDLLRRIKDINEQDTNLSDKLKAQIAADKQEMLRGWEQKEKAGSYADESSSQSDSASSNTSVSGEKAHGFYGSTDEYEDYDDYMDAYDDWEYRDYDDEDDWEDDWDEDW